MIDKNILLAYFWANANQIVTADGVEIDLHNDNQVMLSTLLRNADKPQYTIQICAEFSLDAFVAEMKLQLVDDLTEINLDMLMALLMGGKASYQILED